MWVRSVELQTPSFPLGRVKSPAGCGTLRVTPLALLDRLAARPRLLRRLSLVVDRAREMAPGDCLREGRQAVRLSLALAMHVGVVPEPRCWFNKIPSNLRTGRSVPTGGDVSGPASPPWR